MKVLCIPSSPYFTNHFSVCTRSHDFAKALQCHFRSKSWLEKCAIKRGPCMETIIENKPKTREYGPDKHMF